MHGDVRRRVRTGKEFTVCISISIYAIYSSKYRQPISIWHYVAFHHSKLITNYFADKECHHFFFRLTRLSLTPNEGFFFSLEVEGVRASTL